MNNKDPQLIPNSEGYLIINSTSPAVNSSSSQYPVLLDIPVLDDDPSILFDIAGNTRPADRLLKDAGCFEVSSGVIKNRPLKLSDVGPEYLKNQTSVEKEKKEAGHSKLLQNFPNPFNPETTIKYNVPEVDFHNSADGVLYQQYVSLKIYDLLGREVSTLVDELKLPGNYSAVFNARNITDTYLTSGIYFCRLQAGKNIEIQKMILLK